MGSLIVEDTRQQEGRHDVKHAWWSSHGVDVVRHKLDTGDYMTVGSPVTVDTKASLAELVMDVGSDHRRFRAEMVRARDSGLHLVVLVESSPRFAEPGELARWPGRCSECRHYRRRECHPSLRSCRRYRYVPMQGAVLAETIGTMADRYGCEFRFCDPEDSARIVCDLLGVPYKS